MTAPNDDNVACGYWFLNTGKDDSMIDACAWHDEAYTEGTWKNKNLTRKETDQWFLNQMLQIAGGDKVKIAKAYTFYALTRTFGWMFWEGK